MVMIHAMHGLMRTLFRAKHVSFVNRLVMFWPGVNTVIDTNSIVFFCLV